MLRLLPVLALTLLSLGSTCHVPKVNGPLVGRALTPAVKWTDTPAVRVCPESPVSVDEVQYALDLWASHGAPSLRALASRCYDNEGLMDEGFVYIDIHRPEEQSWDPGTLGSTYVPQSEPRSWAVILLTDADMRVLTHEIGHIWVDHSSVAPHVLYPSIHEFDWSAWDDVKWAFLKAGY